MTDLSLWQEHSQDNRDPDGMSRDVFIGLLDRAIASAHIVGVGRSKAERIRNLRDLWANSTPNAIVDAFCACVARRKTSWPYFMACTRNGSNGGGAKTSPQTETKQDPRPESKPGVQYAASKRQQQGYISLWRSVLDHWTFKDRRHWAFKAWCWMLMNAAYEPTVIYRFGKKFMLEPGQLDCTEAQLAAEFDVPHASINRFMMALVNNGEITRYKVPKIGETRSGTIDETIGITITKEQNETIKKGKPIVGFTIITILKYKYYQSECFLNGVVEDETIDKKQSETIAGGKSETRSGKLYRIINNNIYTPPIPPPKENTTTTAVEFLRAYENNRGGMQSIATLGDYENNSQLLAMASYVMHSFAQVSNGDLSLALEKWTDVIRHAGSQVHPTRWSYVDFEWLSKSIANCMKVLKPAYSKPFDKGDADARKTSSRSDKGNSEQYKTSGFKVTPPVSTVQRVDVGVDADADPGAGGDDKSG